MQADGPNIDPAVVLLGVSLVQGVLKPWLLWAKHGPGLLAAELICVLPAAKVSVFSSLETS